MLGTILLIILILLLVGALPRWDHSRGWGYGPSGGLGLIVIILIVFLGLFFLSVGIGLDLGGTNLRAAAIDREGKLLHLVTGRTQYSEGRAAIMGDMVEAISSVRDKQGADGLA